MTPPKKGEDKWLWPPPDQWLTVWSGFVLLAFIVLSNGVLDLLNRFGGSLVGLAVAMLGAILLLFAKLPLYREHRFFTFGPGSIVPARRAAYWCGLGLAIIGIVVATISAIL